MKAFFSRHAYFWKISSIFLLLLTSMAIIYVLLTARAVEMYSLEATQRLNAPLAQHIVEEANPFINDEMNEDAIKELFHDIMVYNPSAHIYLLDPRGEILTYYAQSAKVKTTQVPLAPIKSFIDAQGKICITGEDPKNPEQPKVFSAAPIKNGDKLNGYIYVTLGSEDYNNTMDLLLSSYKLKIGSFIMLITFIAAFIIGLLAFWLITSNLSAITSTVKKFKNGDYSARVNLQSSGDLLPLGETFNEMADRIERNFDELQTVEALRRELIANVSHDLRTPLAGIQGYAETLMLKGERLSEDDRNRYTSVILKGTKKLEKLVNELFELSKLEAKQTKPAFEPFSIAELIQDNIQKYSIGAREKDIRFHFEAYEKFPLVNGDIFLIDRVLQNLIDNALKFTSKDGHISFQLTENKNRLKVSIADTGEGISESELPDIFNRFVKAGKTDKQRNGSGLGLAIAQKLLNFIIQKLKFQA